MSAPFDSNQADMARHFGDVLATRALCERYAQAVDAGDTDAFVSLFTADGALTSEFGGAETQFNGREELAQVVAGAKWVAQRTMHFIGNHLAEIDGDTATGARIASPITCVTINRISS